MECPICYMEIDEKQQIKLKCGHTFHRFCLCETYKIDKTRQCPYCRSPYSPIQLQNDETFIKGFHKQNPINKNTCIALLRSGVRKGEICNVITENNCKYCKRHNKILCK